MLYKDYSEAEKVAQEASIEMNCPHRVTSYTVFDFESHQLSKAYVVTPCEQGIQKALATM